MDFFPAVQLPGSLHLQTEEEIHDVSVFTVCWAKEFLSIQYRQPSQNKAEIMDSRGKLNNDVLSVVNHHW